MFDSYAQTITFEPKPVVGLERAVEEVRVAVTTGTSPVKVIGGPGTGKVTATLASVRGAGYAAVEVNTGIMDSFDLSLLPAKIDQVDGEAVLVIDLMNRNPDLADEALAALAENTKVRQVIVIETPGF